MIKIVKKKSFQIICSYYMYYKRSLNNNYDKSLKLEMKSFSFPHNPVVLDCSKNSTSKHFINNYQNAPIST